MRIAVVTSIFPTSSQPWRGHSVYQTIKRLAQNADVEVFSPHAQYPGVLSRFEKRGKEFDPAYQPEGVRTHYITYPAIPRLTRRLNGSLAARSILASVQRFNPDVLFGYFVYPDGYAALRVGKRLHKPVAVKAIGSDINAVPPSNMAATRRVLTDVDKFLTVSAALREKAISMGASQERTISIINGCDGEIFRVADRTAARSSLGIQNDAELVVFVGRLDVRKGLLELIDAASALRRRRPALDVCIIGEGHDEPAVRSAIQHSGADAFIRLLGAKNSSDVAVWMAASNLVTLPSYAEGCPNVVIEALSCGRPVVATNVGGIPELMDRTCGELIPPKDARALESALDATLSRNWVPEVIASQHSRTWETVADETLTVLGSLL